MQMATKIARRQIGTRKGLPPFWESHMRILLLIRPQEAEAFFWKRSFKSGMTSSHRLKQEFTRFSNVIDARGDEELPEVGDIDES